MGHWIDGGIVLLMRIDFRECLHHFVEKCGIQFSLLRVEQRNLRANKSRLSSHRWNRREGLFDHVQVSDITKRFTRDT